ncbi:MAG: excinuclease ABC subunit UvrC [Acidobacteriota bacterium]
MDLHEKIRTLPAGAGCYLYKNAEGEVIYVGKAKNLRARVRSYFLDAAQANAKTGSLMREAVDLEYILVANEQEALALENNLIKQRKPRFNILLRDDKTYPYIKLTLADRHPKVFVTRRVRKDGSAYFGPYFPGSLASRLVDLIHRNFLIPSCKVDLNRYHPRACLQYYIHRCLGPCVEGLVSSEAYAQAVRDAQLFLEGKSGELEARLTERMRKAAEEMQFELAAKLRDQISTLHQAQHRQRIASAEEEDVDVFGFHLENGMLALNLFHMRSGKIVDRREMFWEELPEIAFAEALDAPEPGSEQNLEPDPDLSSEAALAEADTATSGVPAAHSPRDDAQPLAFSAAAFLSALLKQLYLDQTYVPRNIYVPVDFPDRLLLAEALSQRLGRKIEISAPQRGEKRSLLDLAGQNAKQSFDQRFRVLQPGLEAIQGALQDALLLPEPPQRIECFDISHIQGAETVASMVVWEKGAMKNSSYRKFQVKTVSGVDDFASMREVVHRRYSRLQQEGKPMPSLVLIDGGLGQLHAAAAALEALGLVTQPLASIAKREEILYLHGQEDEPVVLERRSPVLHLIQKIRDESHRFAVTYHRKRRQMRDRASELDEIPGVGPITRRRLLEHFGSIQALQQTAQKDPEALTAVVNKPTAEKIRQFFAAGQDAATPGDLVRITPH